MILCRLLQLLKCMCKLLNEKSGYARGLFLRIVTAQCCCLRQIGQYFANLVSYLYSAPSSLLHGLIGVLILGVEISMDKRHIRNCH
jgi:hypothetical protein